jgi:uncharacterized membrane protein YdbT with pleckstrin-like domain
MASYIEGALTPGETVLHNAHVSWWSLWGPLALGLVTLPLFGLGLIAWGYAWVQYKTTELAITNKRVIVKTGFISRQTIELNIAKVESIQVNQTMMGRMLDYGSLLISGGGNPQAPINGISEPLAFRKAFMEAQDGSGLNLRRAGPA